MCLLAFAYRTEPLKRLGLDLVLIANRDEYFSRPTEPAHFWQQAQGDKDSAGAATSEILAGKDALAGGTWMGVTRSGRFALLTNYRDPTRFRKDVKSRGMLVSDFLQSDAPPRHYLQQLKPRASEYNDFNLIVGTRNDIAYLSSLNGELLTIAPGLYGLSNHLFETPWPKVVRAREGLRQAIEAASPDENLESKLLEILSDPTRALDSELPKTGIGEEHERALSSIFITMPGYGTRSSTLLLMHTNGGIDYVEKTWPEDRTKEGELRRFNLQNRSARNG